MAKPHVRDRVSVHAASEVVDNGRAAGRCAAQEEGFVDARRRQPREGRRRRDACVSAGNTGALMAIARFVLKTLPGIDRPAIASQLPSKPARPLVLDLGANVNCTPAHLLQFAVMGSALVAAVDGIERPTIGLLNIGEEDIKGNDVVKETAELLKASTLNFVRQRRRRRHLQRHDGRRRLRRLRRQRRAQDVRGTRADALRVPAGPNSRAIP